MTSSGDPTELYEPHRLGTDGSEGGDDIDQMLRDLERGTSGAGGLLDCYKLPVPISYPYSWFGCSKFPFCVDLFNQPVAVNQSVLRSQTQT